jgi:hypothetical protein
VQTQEVDEPSSSPQEETVPEVLNFKVISEKVFEPGKCMQCHNPNNLKGDLDLTSYESIASNFLVPGLLKPGSPEESSLYKSVRDNKMPTDKSGYPKLSLLQKEILRMWIEKGALQN